MFYYSFYARQRALMCVCVYSIYTNGATAAETNTSLPSSNYLMAQYSVSPRAYALALLHAAKYPDAQVCGLLLGSLDKDGEVNVTTGLPLFHHWASLTPMLEVALTQASKHTTFLS